MSISTTVFSIDNNMKCILSSKSAWFLKDHMTLKTGIIILLLNYYLLTLNDTKETDLLTPLIQISYTQTLYSWNQMILEQHACYNLPLWHVLRVDMLNAILVPVKSAYKANEVMNELINEPLQTGASSSWAQRIPRGYTMTRRTNSLPSHTGSDK